METPSHQPKTEAELAAGRRSTRLHVSIPVILSAKDTSGHAFKENTRTIIINKHGAKVATFHQLALGAEILVENRSLGRTAKASVVWLGERPSPKDPAQIGLQLFEAENIWGVEFPPEDWQEASQKTIKATKHRKVEPAGAEVPPAPDTKPSPEPAKIGGEARPPVNANLEQATYAAAEIFEQRLARTASEIGAQARASMQDAADALERKLTSVSEERLRAMVEKLDSAHRDIDTLLSDLRKIQDSGKQEVERARDEIRSAGAHLLQSSLGELSARFSKELEDRQADLTAKISNQITQTSVEQLGKALDDHCTALLSGLESRLSGAAEQAGQKTSEEIQNIASELSTRLGQENDRILSQSREELAKTLQQAAGEQATESIRSLQEQIQWASSSAEQDLKATLARVSEQEIATSAAGFLEQIKSSAGVLLDGMVHETLTRLRQEAAKCLEKYLEAAKEDLVRSSKEAIAGIVLESQRASTEEARKQLSTLTKSTVESLNKGALAGLDQYGSELRKRSDEDLAATAERLKTMCEDAVREAADLIRASIAGVLASLAPSIRKSTETEQP